MKKFGLVLLVTPAASLADTAPNIPEGETVVIIGRAPDPDDAEAVRDRERALGDAPFVTVVHADEHPATASVADAIGTTVGAQSRSLGGLGAYASVSVRGAAPGHTAVTIDGVPMARIASVTTDLGRFVLASFGEVALYRGTVPIELGGAGVGGALDLVTRLGRGPRGERLQASLGGGSFGSRHAHFRYGDAHADGTWLSSTTLNYQGATGDYTYFYDSGTPLNTNDDQMTKRGNNGFQQLDISSRLGAMDRTAAGGLRIAYKDQGLPGSVYQPSHAASLATLDVIADARGDIRVGPATAEQLGYLLVERQRLRDPLGELGLGAQARDYVTVSGGASSTWTATLGRHRLTSGLDLRGDWFRDSDAAEARAALRGNRVGAAALAALDLALDPASILVVTPAFRLDALRTAPTPMTEGPDALASIPPRVDLVPSPRLSARAAVHRDVSIKASAGWYVRLPTLIELFGNRGTIVGSPNLRPERGPNAEVGVVVAPSRAVDLPLGGLKGVTVDRILFETAGFATNTRDLIALIPSGGFVAHAVNVADAITYGFEVVASARFARAVSITANYTRLITAQRVPDPAFTNKPLPRQPGHTVYARADLVQRAFGRRGQLWFDAHWQSDAFLDRASLQRIPARLLVGTGARIELAGNLALSLSVANLANVRVEYLPLVPPPRPDLTRAPTALADFSGFPLPGRSFDLSLEWSHL